ncbi:hypothetical protein GS458_2474 [Geobacillus stearothermophilus]|nr:hypothetical protein GS458_2474 [Geobacillus stearothermophilus]
MNNDVCLSLSSTTGNMCVPASRHEERVPRSLGTPLYRTFSLYRSRPLFQRGDDFFRRASA